MDRPSSPGRKDSTDVNRGRVNDKFSRPDSGKKRRRVKFADENKFPGEESRSKSSRLEESRGIGGAAWRRLTSYMHGSGKLISETPLTERKANVKPLGEIGADEAIEKLEKLKKDRTAYFEIIKCVDNELRNRIEEQQIKTLGLDRQALQEADYRFQFKKAERLYDFVSADGKKRYIGASLDEAAKHLGVKRKSLEQLAELADVDKDGYFGSSSGVKRRQIDSDTLAEVENNRDKWKIQPIYVFTGGSTGKIVFSDNDKFDETKEGKGMKKMSQVLDISKPSTADSADTRHTLFDFTGSDSDAKKKDSDGNSSEDARTHTDPPSPYTPNSGTSEYSSFDQSQSVPVIDVSA